jgi:hypothetical protein
LGDFIETKAKKSPNYDLYQKTFHKTSNLDTVWAWYYDRRAYDYHYYIMTKGKTLGSLYIEHANDKLKKKKQIYFKIPTTQIHMFYLRHQKNKLKIKVKDFIIISNRVSHTL